jgi:hypothetical protein
MGTARTTMEIPSENGSDATVAKGKGKGYWDDSRDEGETGLTFSGLSRA